MGISQADIDFIAEFEVLRVCDLGDQDLLGINGFSKSRDFWIAKGVEYLSLDIVGDATRFDLNTDSVRPEWGEFDLVTNCGDTEHIINQVNCFTVIHNLTKVGGVMYHQLPIAGYSAHGFFNYNVKFFHALAKANRYEIIKEEISVSEGSIHTPPDRRMPAKDAGIRIAMRKKKNTPFSLPLDLPEVQPAFHEKVLFKLRQFVG